MAKNPKKGGGGLTRRAAATAVAAALAAPGASLAAIMAATGLAAPTAKETLKEFVARASVPLTELPEEKFNALPEEAKKWYDDNTLLYNDSKFDQLYPLEGMPGWAPKGATAGTEKAPPAQPAPSAGAAAAAPGTPSTQQEPNVPKNAKGKKGGAAPAAKEKTARAVNKDSTSYQIRSAVVKKPDITFEALCTKVGLKGKEAAPTGHAHNMYQHAKLVMGIALEEGYAKK